MLHPISVRLRPRLLASACGAVLALCATGAALADTVSFAYTGAQQSFTVPAGVTLVKITAAGAQGGIVTGNGGPFAGGLGATMSGEFSVTPGSVLQVVVGGQGNPSVYTSGGGGGSGVSLGATALIVAGGGGGVDYQDLSYTGRHATTATVGVDGNNNAGSGGTAGADGSDFTYSGNNTSRGGRGWLSGGAGSTGLNGVSASTTVTVGSWGLGGGGGSVGEGYCNCGGGGGGYSGGGSAGTNASGGGGGSYNSGANQANVAGNHSGNGVVTLEYTAQAVAPQPVPLFSWWALLALSPLLAGGTAWSLRRPRQG